jgi:hypothetical protein
MRLMFVSGTLLYVGGCRINFMRKMNGGFCVACVEASKTLKCLLFVCEDEHVISDYVLMLMWSNV